MASRLTLLLLLLLVGCARGVEPEKSALSDMGTAPSQDAGAQGGGSTAGENTGQDPGSRDGSTAETDADLSVPPSPGLDAGSDAAVTPETDAGTPPAKCDDQNPCTNDLDTLFGCTHLATAGSCDDGLSCTSGDACNGGTCRGTDTCGTGTSCLVTIDACGQCATNADCNDSQACTSDVCSAGTCEHTPLSGTACDDGIACTTGDLCSAGSCAGTPSTALCDDQNPCTDDACGAGSGCTHTTHTRACDDGVGCTNGDACTDGTCTGQDSCGPDQSCDLTTKMCRARLLELYLAATTSFGPTSANAFALGDVAEVDTDTLLSGNARWVGERTFFDHTLLSGSQTVDGFSRESSGAMLLSTTGDSSLSNLSFNRADIVRYAAGVATRVFNGRSLLDCSGSSCDDSDLDVDAVHALDNGDILFSMTNDFEVTASGATFGRGSIMRYTPGSGQIVEVVSDTFLEGINVDGIAVHPFTGHLLLSSSLSGASFGGGFSFDDEDVIELSFGPSQTPVTGYSYFIDGTADLTDYGSDITAIDLR